MFSAAGNLDGDVLRRIALQAGVHIYSSTHPVYVNSVLTGVYAFEDAELSLREDGVYEDVFTGRRYHSENRRLLIPAGELASKLLLKVE